MGTVFRLHAFYPPGRKEWMHGLADRVFDTIIADDKRLSIYQPQSETNSINRAAGKEPVEVSADTCELIEFCGEWCRKTGGLFDIGAGILMAAYGFHSKASWPAPGPEFLNSLKENPDEFRNYLGCEKIIVGSDPPTVRLVNPGMLIDLGGAAKGWVIRKCARILEDEGLKYFVISAGNSSVLARGAPPGKPSWPMELEPTPLAPDSPRMMNLTDCSVSVSGNYRNTRTDSKGLVLRHIMNPLILRPVETIRQVTVIGPDAAETEVFSTAYLIQGALDGWFELSDRPDIKVEFTSLDK